MSQQFVLALAKVMKDQAAAKAAVDDLPEMDMSNPMSAIKHAKQSKPVFEAYQAANDELVRMTATILLKLMQANLPDDAPDTPALAGDVAPDPAEA